MGIDELDKQFEKLNSLLETLQSKQQEAIAKADKMLTKVHKPKPETEKKEEN
ncbi:MAG: hypothetical protein QNJ68_07885 [Microcoleaceae cyanobacterium MO_207.B10]|nr:hypothetical protein [Microcoleaceae cyanobacterium MO_207.B10]